MEGTPVGRRVVLGMMGTGLAGIVFGSKAADLLERVVAPIASRDGTGFLSLFPVGRFRIYTVTGRLHSRSEEGYRLHVAGHVEVPATLTMADLRAMPPTRMTKDFQCVTGWRVEDVEWRGDTGEHHAVQREHRQPVGHTTNLRRSVSSRRQDTVRRGAGE